MHFRFKFIISFIAIILASPSLGQEDGFPEERYCNVGSIDLDGTVASLVKIRQDAAKTHFIGDKENKSVCPNTTPSCRQKEFVIAGDELITISSSSEYLCSSYVSHQGVVTSGFLPRKTIETLPVNDLKIIDWSGKWKRGVIGKWLRKTDKSEINIKISGKKLFVDGFTTWGMFDSRRVESGGVNFGELSNEASIEGGVAYLGYDPRKSKLHDDDSECRVRMKMLGRYLIVEDNSACGGLNVSFTGLYVKDIVN